MGSAAAVDGYYNLADEGDFEDDSGEDVSARKPFKAILDVGLHRTTTGARVFAAVKGACDGGLNIPHSTRRFPGTPAEKDAETDFEVTRKYIFGGHIADYMNLLSSDDEEKFKSQFAVAIQNGVSGDDLEGLWTGIHSAIRSESSEDLLAKDRTVNLLGYFKTRETPRDVKAVHQKKYFNKKSISIQQRKAKIVVRLGLRDARIAARKAELEALSKANAAEEEASASESGSDEE